ncbi:MAG: ribosome maturation factor RimP [Tissierellia bacterium]|jgi:ribosome maturation factor RimP|nr:ribosome maturation factor RimP [Bacillota bacterium]NLK59259.1 ribosome maturation factor RimP [Tissierellia bacterium]
MKSMDFETQFSQPLKDLGVDLIEVEFKKEGRHQVLRFYIDSKEGISMEDCERASRYISQVLDETDPISGSYNLEVSSLGLDRAMKKDKELENAIGKDIILRFYGTEDGQKEISGTLIGFDDTVYRITVETEERAYARDSVASIRKQIKW